jgi:hypothetical protein
MEESPVTVGEEEDLDDGQSSPATSEANSMISNHRPDGESIHTSATSTILSHPPRNKLLLKPFTAETSVVSPPATPRSPLPPSPLRRTPSPSESTKAPSEHEGRDSYGSSASNSMPSEQSSSRNNSPVPIPPPVNAPPTPPPPPEKIRLLKALEIRRQKLSGQTVILIPKIIEAPNSATKIVHDTPIVTLPIIPTPSPERQARMIEAKRAAMEQHRRHISALEQSGRDLLCGWVNFQSSTSLVLPSFPPFCPFINVDVLSYGDESLSALLR